MRVLHVDTGTGWRGGQKQVFGLHKGLIERGIASHVITRPSTPLAEKVKEEELPLTTLPLRGEWDVPSALGISRLMKDQGVTHLHLHSSHAHTLGLIAAKLNCFSDVVVSRRVAFPPQGHLLSRWKYGAGIKRFVVVSEAVGEVLVAYGIDPGKVKYVPSGVEPDKVIKGTGAAIRAEFGLPEDALLTGTIASLTGEKGLPDLLAAFPKVLAKVPTGYLLLVGDGPLRGELEKSAEASGIKERVIFAGFREDVDPIMDALDLFVLPSHAEGLGTAAIDALAANKPVVASNVGGLPEVVEEGVSGYLVPPASPAPLAEAIIALLVDGDKRSAFGLAGRKRVLEKYSLDAMVEGNLTVYREL